MTETASSTDPGQRAVDFFERMLVHTKGKWAGAPFALESWQRDGIIRPLFGSLREDGTRQYRTAFVALPRKNGKSEIVAGVGLKLLFADGEPGAEIYSAAADKDQASIVFNVAWDMVEANPALRKRSKRYRAKVIEVPSTGSVYRAISADAFSKHGFNAHGILFDEVHTQPTRELWDVLTTSTGARTQPLVFGITTAGYDQQSICFELWDYAAKVLSGVIEDPTFFAYIRSAPKDADWRDERVWKASNPALGVFRSIEEMREMAKRAEHTPALQNTFRRLYLNQWTSQETRWLDLSAWDDTAGLVVDLKLEGRRCYAGLDLASTTDIAALELVFPMDDGTFEVLSHFWIPGDNIQERVRRDRVPYDAWVSQGLITATEGNVIDYGAIREKIRALGTRFDIREIGFDRWGATQLSQDLAGDGFTVVPIGQGFSSMSAPTKELLNLVLSKRLRHGGSPVLRWMADNMVVRTDPAGNLKPDKQKSREKIDGMVALVMGIDRATRNVPSRYERGELLVLG
jgi:phage terminase large subunit-like protein